MAQLEEENRHLEFMGSVCKYDQDQEDGHGGEGRSQEKSDPVVDLFPDDQDDDRNSKCNFGINKSIKQFLVLNVLLNCCLQFHTAINLVEIVYFKS